MVYLFFLSQVLPPRSIPFCFMFSWLSCLEANLGVDWSAIPCAVCPQLNYSSVFSLILSFSPACPFLSQSLQSSVISWVPSNTKWTLHSVEWMMYNWYFSHRKEVIVWSKQSLKENVYPMCDHNFMFFWMQEKSNPAIKEIVSIHIKKEKRRKELKTIISEIIIPNFTLTQQTDGNWPWGINIW